MVIFMTKTLITGWNNKLTETELENNYDYFIELIKEKFTGERLEGLLKMYSEDNLGIQLCTAPASGKADFHYAFPGGYLLHILNVEKASRGQEKLFAAMGGIIDYMDEERLFAALHHDLGKLGDTEFGPYYTPQTNDWRAKTLGEIYGHSETSPPWDATDRALYLLQQFGVKSTWKETLAIKLSDGVFVKKNEDYWKSMKDLRTSLCNIIHWADWMSCRVEKTQYYQTK